MKEKKRERYVNNCVVIKTIPTFSGKTFVTSGIDYYDDIKAFLIDKGAYFRTGVSGKTDYLIVSPELAGDSKYRAVLEQAAKGHTVEIIFYEDFINCMNDDINENDTDIVLTDADNSSTDDVELNAAIDSLTGEPAESVMKSVTDHDTSDIKQEGSTLLFDDAFSIEIPSGIVFLPETNENYAKLTGLLKDNNGDSIELTIHPLDFDKSGAMKASLEESVNRYEGKCAYLMLFEDNNTEVAVLIQAGVLFTEMKMVYTIIPMIRVGKHCYGFRVHYCRSGFALADALKQDIIIICKLFDSIKIQNSKKRIKPEIDKNKLDKIVDKMFGINIEAASALGEHCSVDTPAIVLDDWIITVPAGYMYSTDNEIVGHRPIVLGLDDGTLDLSSPFGSTINFSVTLLPIGSQGDKIPDLPLDHPSMSNFVNLVEEPQYICLRKDSEMIITYRIMNFYQDEPCISRGYILTRHNLYAFQLFDNQSNNKTEAEAILRKLLLSIKTKDEYEESQIDAEEVISRITKLDQKLQVMRSKVQEMVIQQKDTTPNNEADNHKQTSSSLPTDTIKKKRSSGNKRVKLTIENNVLTECHTNDAEIIIPDGVTRIKDQAFFNRKKLKSVIIPPSVSWIENNAFAYSGISAIEIPETVHNIGDGVFSLCKSLAKVKLPDNIEKIPNNIFCDCANLISINIPDSVEEIGSRAFCCCFSISFIKLPNGLKSIGSEAFLACRALTMIEIPDDVEIIEHQTFAGCYSLKSISLPVNIKRIEQTAFAECSIDEIIIRNDIAKLKEKLKSYEYYLKNDMLKISEEIPEEKEKRKYEKQIAALENELNNLAFFKIKRKKDLQNEVIDCNIELERIKNVIKSKKEVQQQLQERILFYEEEIRRIKEEIIVEQEKTDKVYEMVKHSMKNNT